MWQEKLENETWTRQAPPTTSGRGSFFSHVGACIYVTGIIGQHLVISVTDDTRGWRAAASQRIRAARPSLAPFVAFTRRTLNGKEAGAVCRPEGLEDATSRRSPGLLGGAPRAQDVPMTKDVGTRKRDELMQYAERVLGVGVRRPTANPPYASCEAVPQGGASLVRLHNRTSSVQTLAKHI